MFTKTTGIRSILIHALNRQQLIDFIKRKDETYRGKDVSEYSDIQLRDIAHVVDKKAQDKRRKKHEF